MNNPHYRRFPAEWEIGDAVMLAWPHAGTDWADMLAQVDECYRQLVEAITIDMTAVIVTPEPAEVARKLSHIDPSHLLIVECETNDTWTRDYGPLTVETSRCHELLNFKFNGWGLKFAADKDNLVNGFLARKGVLTAPMECCLSFVLEGGSVETDGNGTLLTTSRCLLSPNRNGGMTREQITDELINRLGVNKVLWLDHGALEGDDTDSHIDTLARFAPDNIILYVGTNDQSDSHYPELSMMANQLQTFTNSQGHPFNLIELPLPSPIYDADGNRLPGTYANYLVTPHAVLMPTYGQPRNDELASQILKIAYPHHDIRHVDCRALIEQHGSLHCATMQLNRHTIINLQ